MLLLDFWMQYEEKGRCARKRFTLYGDTPEIRLNLNALPYIHIQNGKMFEIENGNAQPFTPRLKINTGKPFSVEEVLQDVVMRLARNETGVMDPVFVNEVVKTYAEAFHKTIAAHQGRNIPYYILFDKRFLKLEFATDRFLYYDDELEMPVMFRTEDGTLVSNNEFSEIGYLDSLDAIELGEESVLAFEAPPVQSVQEFVSSHFPNAEKDEMPELAISAVPLDDDDILPF